MSRPPIILPTALDPLAAEQRWMVWKLVKNKKGKLTKPPYRADAPDRHASSTDPSTWRDLATAMGAYMQGLCDGIGLALFNSEIGAFDLDDCRDATTGVLHPWAQDKIERAESYAEVTPSGEGVRIIGIATGPPIHRKLSIPNANGVSVELYRRAERFITVTGRELGAASMLANIDGLLDQTLAELARKPTKPPKRDLDSLIKNGCGEDFGGDRSRAVWYVINQLLKQGRAPDDIVAILLDRANGISQHVHGQPRPPEYARRQVEKAQAADPRPTISLEVGHTERIVNELENLLIDSNRGLYQRGALIVSTGFAKMKAWDKKDVIAQVIEERGNYAMLEDMQAVANFLGFDKKGNLRPVNPTQPLVLTLKDRKSRLRLPILTGIVNCPSISSDGELLDQPGYDPATGVLFDPLDVQFPRVPDLPTKAMVQTALANILRAIETFAFETDDDKAVATSGIITGVARRGLPFAALHGFDAPVAGSGKSKLVYIISIVATGRRAAVMSQGDPPEFAKALCAILMRGDPLIPIDNCSQPLGGDLLNMALTQEFVEVRIIGYNKMITVQTKALITVTGNNLHVIGDLTRRCVIGRLDPKCERPELSQFDFDPIGYAMENRAQLVVDCLTILKAYHNAGRPNPPPRLQSFEHWSDTVRAALLWLGQGDPVRTMERLRKSDTAISDMIALFSAWYDEFADERVTANEAIEKAEAHMFVEALGTAGSSHPLREKQYTHGRLHNALMAVAKKHGQLDAGTLGKWLRSAKQRVVTIGEPGNEFAVAMVADGEKHGGVAAWKLQRRE
jgi:hypothetical protein